MATEKEEIEVKEEIPEWAKNLQESLNSLPDRLANLLHPQQEETEETEETLDPTQPQEIPLPQPPEQDPPKPEQVTEEPEEKPKKRKLLDWLL